MAIAKAYGNFIVKALNKEIDFNSDTIKVALLSSSYVPDQDVHDYFDDVSSYEVTGTGYTAGGATISNCTVTYTGATNTCKLDGDDATWSSSTITARYAVIYDSTPGTPGTNPLIAYLDFESNQSSDSGDFKMIWGTNGILSFEVG
jgi:hypothetical protein